MIPRARRGAVLLIVMVAMMFAALALTLFIEKAGTDLLVESRDADAKRLRTDAYSAMETTLGVLLQFKEVLGDLHSPLEGWGDPLGFIGYDPGEGRTVEVSFRDESGRIPLVNTDYTRLVTIFENWGMKERDAERAADALMAWTKKSYVTVSGIDTELDAYERAEIPFAAPGRPLKSYRELATIAVVNKLFFDEDGVPNGLYHRFTETFSLLDYKSPNINSAVPEVLITTKTTETGPSDRLSSFRNGTGSNAGRGAGYFKTTAEATRVLGLVPEGAAFDTVIQALRVIVTVREGNTSYTLSSVVAFEGGAALTAEESAADPLQPEQTNPVANPTNTAAGEPTGERQKLLNYPFTILEMSENDVISPLPEPLPEAPRP